MSEFYLLASVLVPVVGSFLSFIRKREIWAALVCTASFILICLLLPPVLSKQTINFSFVLPLQGLFNLSFYADSLGVLFALVFSFIGTLTLIYSFSFMRGEENLKEYYFLISLLTGAAVGVCFSRNLILLYIFWEVAAFSAWRLYGFFRGERDIFSANRAFLFTFLGSSIMLLGFVFLYTQAGTLDLIKLRAIQVSNLNLILFLILLGIIGKSALLPLQIWLPDAYSGAPLTICALSSALIAKIGIFSFARIFCFTFGLAWDWILILAVITIIVGAAAALLEEDIKRIIAYSTISQIGYIFLGLVLLSKVGLIAGLLYFLAHALAKTGLFLGAGAVQKSSGERNLSRLGGLMGSMRLTGIGFLLCSFSIVGFPPFVGFFAKLMVIWGLVEAGHFWIAGAAAFGAMLTLAYLLRLFHGVFLGEGKITGKEKLTTMSVPIVLLGVISLVLGVFVAQAMGLPNLAVASIFK